MAKRKILIVDDEVAGGGLEELLTKLGYDVDLIAATDDKADAARALQQLEDSFFETSIDMLCALDFNMHFRRLSPAWERTLGFTREELLSRPFIEFVHPDDRERTLKQNAEVRSGGRALSFEPVPVQGWLVSVVSLECRAAFDREDHLLRCARYHRREAGGRRTRKTGARANGCARRSENSARDPADLFLLQEDSRRRKLLSQRRGLHL
jgi:PAS domain-containing protein